MAFAGSSAYLDTCARPPGPIHSGVNASSMLDTTPASIIALATCGRPTTPPPAISLTCSQVTGTPSSVSLSTMARARYSRLSLISAISPASASFSGSKR